MNSAPMDLVTLHLAVAVSDCGSISAGSDRVQLALGAASARISALEAAMGVRIFGHSSRGVQLSAQCGCALSTTSQCVGAMNSLPVDAVEVAFGDCEMATQQIRLESL